MPRLSACALWGVIAYILASFVALRLCELYLVLERAGGASPPPSLRTGWLLVVDLLTALLGLGGVAADFAPELRYGPVLAFIWSVSAALKLLAVALLPGYELTLWTTHLALTPLYSFYLPLGIARALAPVLEELHLDFGGDAGDAASPPF